MKQFLEPIKGRYDYVLLDCMPSLGMLTVNSLVAADFALIPLQANYLSAKGLEKLLQTINKVKRQINPKLRNERILLTMVDGRTNYAKDISSWIRATYGDCLRQKMLRAVPLFLCMEEEMAATRLIALHVNKGKTVDHCLNEQLDYSQNPIKTEKGELITAYAYDPETAAMEFLLSKRQYQQVTGKRLICRRLHELSLISCWKERNCLL